MTFLQVPTVDANMVKARVTLQNLKTLSYNFPANNYDLAKQFTEQLDQIYQSFYARLPNEAGLIILQGSQRKREQTKSASLYGSLPPRKKFKLALSKRVGIKAEQKRKELNQSKASSSHTS